MESDDRALPAGKLPAELLARLLGQHIRPDPRVLIGPGVGRDAAAIAIGDKALVVKTDPITFATAEAGWYLVNVNANDIACMGATPRWLLATALFPEHATTPRFVEEVFGSVDEAARELGIALVGGHTEITVGLDRLILVGQLLGEADPSELLDLRRCQPGDAVLLCGGVAVEGTALLAREAAEALSSLPPDLLARAAGFLRAPGLSVLPGVRALRFADVELRGLHDPTEGGLATALAELSAASGLGIQIDAARVNVYPETRAICDALALDPLGLIASGVLLAVTAPGSVERASEACRAAGIPCARIGVMLEPGAGAWLSHAGVREPLPTFAVDEIARFFSGRDA